MAPQLRIWTWGPAMLCFCISALAALPVVWKHRSPTADRFVVISGFLLVLWITIRAITTPVTELAQADGLLTAMSVATFVSFRAIASTYLSERFLTIGLAAILLASSAVIAFQLVDPTFSPIFPNEENKRPAGFFAHYSYGASFLIPLSLILGAVAIHSGWHSVVRILLGIIAVSGLVAVYLTKSRGGVIGIGSGLTALIFLSILSGKQSGKKWFFPAIIVLPVLMVVLGIALMNSLADVQESRSGSGDLNLMLDNTIRFYLLSIAISSIATHPLLGGGSRSYSWESFQFWDTKAMGRGSAKPEHVHNEFVQTAHDYGLLGAGLLLVFLLVVVVIGVHRITDRHVPANERVGSFWRIGGLAGFVGLFAQSQFEGILRLPSGAVLLALCFSAACLPLPRVNRAGSSSVRLSSPLICLSAIIAAIPLALFGWKGSLVSKKLWPVYFSDTPSPPETKADALTEAISIWPLGSLYYQRGITYQLLASKSGNERTTEEFVGFAVEDYRMAGKLHPFSPGPAVNSATLLSALGRDDEAEAAFRRALALQGEMEAAFRTNTHFSEHLHKKGIRRFSEGDFASALTTFQLAAKYIEVVADLYGDHMASARAQSLRVNIHESIGRTLEETGNYEGAIQQYDFVANNVRSGDSAHYRAGVLLGKRAVAAWSERRSEDALALFQMALDRTMESRNLPEGVTREKKSEYVRYLRNTIKYLKGAKVEPSGDPAF